MSPWRMENVKRLVRGRYSALSKSLVNSDRMKDNVVSDVVESVKKEIKLICKKEHDSIIADTHEAVKRFSWDTIWLELNQMMPILMKMLTGIVHNPQERKPMICLMASMILKSGLPKMALAQRALSIFLYGNGASKQVIYVCIHTL